MPFGAQMVTLLNNLGRNSEIIDTLRTNVESHPHIVAWRAALARAYTTTDQLEEAREHLDVLIGDRLAPPPHNWVTTDFYSTVSEVVTDLGSQEAASVLYERLQPIAGQVSVVSAAVTCSGSFAFYCGRLAVCLGRHDDAQRHFSDALAMNERLGARPWVVRTRRVWADMLVDRGAAGDTAEARDLIATALPEAETLGMAREVVCLERLKARLA
ncbi:MAG: tetratricopeptide repeat protein [Planctomycetota bacterium]|jgi:tetratricopeptide (TPR) repeat protein